MANMTRKGQVYSVGNYLMTGKVLGKGHFARVEEATHRIIGKKVAIKIIDLTCIKEEYARRNLHREPRVMAKLRHPCIAALYETMMHGPRLYVVMEAAGGGDLSTHVLCARSSARGLPEGRARALATQLVSAVRHMHARGVVHRDLKMENIMLDNTKQFIKIVDFGLSNVWSAGGALRTPCGSLEYAAPELFVDGRRYGPEVDLWSIGVIVYGMVTGSLPFTGADGKDGQSRPQLRAAITRGFTRKQRAALACVSTECKAFIQHLLEPNVELRMKIEEATRHRWIRKPGLRMKTHPLAALDPKVNREIYKQVAELCGQTTMDVISKIKTDPFGATAGIYNIKTHLQQMQAAPGCDMLWSTSNVEPRATTPPEYRARTETDRTEPTSSKFLSSTSPSRMSRSPSRKILTLPPKPPDQKLPSTGVKQNGINRSTAIIDNSKDFVKTQKTQADKKTAEETKPTNDIGKKNQAQQSPRTFNRSCDVYAQRKSMLNVYENGDCCLDARLPSIIEHSNTDLNESRRTTKGNVGGTNRFRKFNFDDRSFKFNYPNGVEEKRSVFYRKAGDGLPSWRACGMLSTPPARILLQNNATTIKRASLGNIASPHSSSNSHSKSERAMPVEWISNRSQHAKETNHTLRLRRTAPMK